jgi:curved DNA-binding protein
MKYKDYYEVLGIGHDATLDEIKKAYRKLAHQYHPDISTDPAGEAKFKVIAEAYKTLKDPEKRKAYDQLGRHPEGQDFEPPPAWEQQFGGSDFSFNDIDLADLFASFSTHRQHTGRQGAARPIPGQDYEVTAQISLAEAYRGTLIDLSFSVPEPDAQGRMHSVQQTFKARIPRGVTDGQKLRLAGKGGRGIHGGRNGDLYLHIVFLPHGLYRVKGHDLYLDLPLAPWEAALGAAIDVPTLGGAVRLKIPAGTSSGRQFRVAHRGLPKQVGDPGDLFVLVQLVVPSALNPQEQALFRQLAAGSTFDPRLHFAQELAK